MGSGTPRGRASALGRAVFALGRDSPSGSLAGGGMLLGQLRAALERVRCPNQQHRPALGVAGVAFSH